MKGYFYELTDVNNTHLFTSKYKSDVVTKKITLSARYREYRVYHLSKFLKIKKRKGIVRFADGRE